MSVLYFDPRYAVLDLQFPTCLLFDLLMTSIFTCTLLIVMLALLV
uniref:Uncharacterized protein n=1 Tax=Arundo donax TaxID=35708 RepID=A0A0A9DR87_ARUDO